MTTDKGYRKRLQDHLKETRNHSRLVKGRIKALGGVAEEVSLPGPDVVSDVASGAANLANRAVAAAKGPGHMLRGTGEQEKLLKNAKSQYWNEFEEIATYYAIETLADFVGDKETHQVAKQIRREEERMAKFLEKLIPKLAKSVAREEIPAALRSTGGGRKRSSASKSRSSSSSSSSSRKSSGSSSRKSSGGSRKSSGGSKKRSSSSGAKRATKSAAKGAKSAARGAKSAAKTARTSAKAASTAAKRSRAGSKGGSSKKSSSKKSSSKKSSSKKSSR
jgi:ferritin-like metal-binding protein YciE